MAASGSDAPADDIEVEALAAEFKPLMQEATSADSIFEGIRRFSNPDESLPLDYINTMMVGLLDNLFEKFSQLNISKTPAPRIFDQAEPWLSWLRHDSVGWIKPLFRAWFDGSSYFPKLDLLKQKLLPSPPRGKQGAEQAEAAEEDDVDPQDVKKIKIQARRDARENYRKLCTELFGHDPVAIDDSEEEIHDRGVEADVKEERAFLHPQEPSQKAKAKPKAAADPAPAKPDDGERGPEPPEAEDGERRPEEGDAPAAVGGAREGAPPAGKKKAGMAAGTNFAGRTPPNTAPWSTRFAVVKAMWIEHIHPQIKPGCYQKSQVHWWKYAVANMDMTVCVTDDDINTRVKDLVGLYAVPYDQKKD
ncbi:pol [Symbiodinium sp. CCMP2592]|nr:pol [Symbiodinium sp. CCMP2592]